MKDFFEGDFQKSFENFVVFKSNERSEDFYIGLAGFLFFLRKKT